MAADIDRSSVSAVMPVVSKAQLGAMHAAKEGRSTLGIPKSVGADFVAASAHQDLSKLPKRAGQYHLKRERKRER